jgi:hypothetical protein
VTDHEPKETQKTTEDGAPGRAGERAERRMDRIVPQRRPTFGSGVSGGTEIAALFADAPDEREHEDEDEDCDIDWARRSFGPRCRTPRPRDPANPCVRGVARQLIVDPADPGAFAEIDDAVAAAQDGDRILVRQGTYRTPVVVDRAVSIEGTGDPAFTVLEPDGGEALGFAVSGGRVERLTIRPARLGNDGALWSAVAVHNVEAIVEGCTLSSHLGATVWVGGRSSALLVQDCDLVSGAQNPVWVAHGGRARLAASSITSHAWAAIASGQHAELRIENCTFVDNLGDAVGARDGALIVVEDCLVRRNAGNGVVLTSAAPASRVTECTIEENRLAGVLVHCSRGTEIRGNRIDGNDTGIGVTQCGTPWLTGNRLSGNAIGIGSRGEGAAPVATGNTVLRSSIAGICVDGEAGGRFEGNTVAESSQWGIWLDDEGTLAQFSGNHVSAGGRGAVLVSNGAAGRFEANDLRGNRAASWSFEEPGAVVRDGNLEDLGIPATDPLALIRGPWSAQAPLSARLVN